MTLTTEAPNRIWAGAWPQAVQSPQGNWHMPCCDEDAEYIRADIHDAEVLALRAEVEKLLAAISGIAPWLAASLDDLEAGHDGAYEAACNAVFDCDALIGSPDSDKKV